MNNEKKPPIQRTLVIVIAALVGLTVLLGIGYLLFPWNTPLDSPLDLGITASLDETTTTIEQDTRTQTLESQISPSPTLEPVCGGPPTMTVLVSGVASKDNYLYGLADAIRLVRIDFRTQEATVLALPRDLWVEIPRLENRGITVGKLNQAYFYGTEGMGYYQGGGYGAGLLAETLLANYDLRVDHYVSVNLGSFRQIINELGGINVYLAQDVYKRVNDQPELFLKAGSHHLNGKQAEILARQRIEIGDYGRINNQTVILKAVAAKLFTPAGLMRVPGLFNQLRDDVRTDFSPAEITQLVCLAERMDLQEDISFVTLPNELVEEKWVFDPSRERNTAALVAVDGEDIRRLLEEFQAGIWP